MDSRRFIGDQQLNEQSKPPEECWCKGVANLGEVKWVQDLSAHLQPTIGEEVGKALIRFFGPHLPLLQQQQFVLPPNSSMLPQQDKPSASRCLKLQFKGDLPAILFTMTKIEDQDVMLEVELLDKSDNRVDFGPESSLKIKIDVLDGDFDIEGRNDLTEEYTKNITPPRKNKGSLLKGNCEIKLSRGVASVSHIAFTDNSKSTRSEKFRLGAKIVKGLPPGVVVMAAVSEAIRVKERRGKSAKLRNAKQSELPKLKTPTHQNSDQELTNLSIIQELPLQPPTLLPPASWTSNVSGFGHSLNANSLSMGSIPPTNVYHDAAAANQACQGYEQTIAQAPNHGVDSRVYFPENDSAFYSLYQDEFWLNTDIATEPAGVFGDNNPSLAFNMPQLISGHRLDSPMSLRPENIPASYSCPNMLFNPDDTGMQQVNFCASSTLSSNSNYKGPADLLAEKEASLADTRVSSNPAEFRTKTQEDMEILRMSMEETPVTTPLQEGRSNVTRKLISVFYMTKAATMFMISVQQDASVPNKKRKHQ